jgi:hypothetical protein
MRTEGLPPELARQLDLEQRANKLREAMLSRPEFVAGIWEGYEEARQGQTLTLAEFEQALDLN